MLSLNFIKRSMPSTVKETVLALLRANRLPRHIQHIIRDGSLSDAVARQTFLGIHHHTSLHENVFCTGSPGVVVECQRNFNFLPIKLPTAYCSHSEVTAIFHCICKYFEFFERQALNQLKCIFADVSQVGLIFDVRYSIFDPDSTGLVCMI